MPRPVLSLSQAFARLAALLVATLTPAAALAQPLADTVFAWQGYGQTSRCRVVVYPSGENEEARTRTIVVRELAGNTGASTLDDARFLVEQIGRTLGVEPASAYWVFHWGGFSFASGGDRGDGSDGDGGSGGKELFLRATFRATDRGRLTPPSWRVVSREDVEEITDRRYRS